jgi:hypothetical protein
MNLKPIYISILLLVSVILTSCTIPARLGKIHPKNTSSGYTNTQSGNIDIYIQGLTHFDSHEYKEEVRSNILRLIKGNTDFQKITSTYPNTKTIISIELHETKRRTGILDVFFFYPFTGYWPISPLWGKTHITSTIKLVNNNNYAIFNLNVEKPYSCLIYPYYRLKKVLTTSFEDLWIEYNSKISTISLQVNWSNTLPLTQHNINENNHNSTTNSIYDNSASISFVDIDIPINKIKNENRYALVIGNEDYKRYQGGLSAQQNVAYAHNDAITFRKYLINTLGYVENQVIFIQDATLAQMNREITRIIELGKLNADSELLIYYAGHGYPDPITNKGYLIPVDVKVNELDQAIALSELYARLATSNSKRITVLLDACFSGGGRGENGLMAARAVRVKPKEDYLNGNIIVFSATSGEEYSLPLENEKHGLFTFYLLKKLKETKGKCTMLELKEYISSQVAKSALLENGVKQSPQVLTSHQMDESWKDWKFVE